MMNKFETFKDAVNHYKKSAENYRRLEVWFDGYFVIFDNHYGDIKKTLGHMDCPRVSLKEIEGYYQEHKNTYKIELHR
tara:strand:+ start:499 stop:732 length:234 start_codon:yes stop_codon:yes gene_type:complete